MRTSAGPGTAIGRAHRLLDRKTGSEEEQDTMMILAVERESGFGAPEVVRADSGRSRTSLGRQNDRWCAHHPFTAPVNSVRTTGEADSNSIFVASKKLLVPRW